MAAEIQPTREALHHACNSLLAKQNVVAAGIGYKIRVGQKTPDICIVCSVEKKLAKAQLSSKELVPQ